MPVHLAGEMTNTTLYISAAVSSQPRLLLYPVFVILLGQSCFMGPSPLDLQL